MARPSKKDYLLRTIREAKGLSKEKVSVLVDSPMHNIWRAEVGRIVSEKILTKIAKVLGVNEEIMFYNMGRFPPDKMQFIIQDPLFFKELIDEACAEPWRLTKTKDYIKDIKDKMEQSKVNPEVSKMLSKLKASE